MKTAIIKLILQMLSNEKTQRRLFLVIASIAVGLFGMMVMPFVVLSVMGEMEAPEIIIDEETLLSGLDTDRLTAMESDGQAIEYYLSSRGMRSQIMKAQLIYLSCFDDGSAPNLEEYTGYFSIGDDAMLVGCLNDAYGFDMDYDEFKRTYMLVKNVTIDKYLFTNVNTKNAVDLAAWCRNAYESEWLYNSGSYGKVDAELQRRTADNVGLILGYFNYNPAEKVFGNSINTLVYTVQGSMDTMPDVTGLGVFTGSEFGIYSGGQVFFASADGRCVEKIPLSDGRWISWCTFEGIEYPQAVWDKINEIQNPTEEKYEETDGMT